MGLAHRAAAAAAPAGPRHRAPRHRRGRRAPRRVALVGARVLAGLAAVAVVVGTGLGWAGYHRAVGGITTSQGLQGVPRSGRGCAEHSHHGPGQSAGSARQPIGGDFPADYPNDTGTTTSAPPTATPTTTATPVTTVAATPCVK